MTQTSLMMSLFKEVIKKLFFCLLPAVENLQNLLFSRIRDPKLLMDETNTQGGQLRRAETFGVADSNSAANVMESKLIYSQRWYDVSVNVLTGKTIKGRVQRMSNI